MRKTSISICQWVSDLMTEGNVNFCIVQEHFKTVRTTNLWFNNQLREYQNLSRPFQRSPRVGSGPRKGGIAQLSIRNIKVGNTRLQKNHLGFRLKY